MNLRTYHDKSMAGALKKVKDDLGRDAVILNTRTFKRGAILGFGGKNVVEITATTQSAKSLPPSLGRGKIKMPSVSPSVSAPSRRSESASADSETGAVRSMSKPSRPAGKPVDQDVRCELVQIRSLVEQMIDETRQAKLSNVPSELTDAYTHLLQRHVADEMARELLDKVRQELTDEQIRESGLVQDRLAQHVMSMIPEGGPILLDGPLGHAKVVALVGPTGVGKTTTIAKLAAHFKLRHHKNVGLITIDTYRIAAVDQLKTYARIIDVPLEVVLAPEELQDAVSRMRWMDLILIDTAGRSQNDTIRLNELESFLSLVEPDEIHLVLSGTTGPGQIRAIVDRFGKLGADHLIFTKLDEAIGLGVILDAIRQVDQRLSYVTTGQDVPDDIEVGRARDLARMILGHEQTPEHSEASAN